MSARRQLAEGLAELGIEAPRSQQAQLLELCELVAAWGERLNLTGHQGPEAVARGLALEACALLAAAPELESLVDLGSGAGFPGIPIAILRPGVEVTLVEARERRHHFQREARRRLGLANLRALHGRAEQLDPEPRAAVVAQALAPPARALPWMVPWAEPGGWLLLPCAVPEPAVPAIPGVVPEGFRRYPTALGGPLRALFVARRGDRAPGNFVPGHPAGTGIPWQRRS